MGPIQTAIPISSAQQQQSAETQTGVMHSGADLLNTMAQQRLSGLYQNLDKINNQISETIKAASTPVPVSGTKAVTAPTLSSFKGIPNDTSRVYTSKQANEQGIANIVRGAASIVGAYVTKEHNDKQKALAVKIERIMEAYHGYSTAQQANDKAAMEKNKGIINSILSDPKDKKQIGKAFQINFIDPSQNNKPEHGAMKIAAKSYFDQLQEKLPTEMEPNQVAIQKLGIQNAQAKTINDQIKAVTSDKLASEIMRYEAANRALDLKQQKEQDTVSHWQSSLKERAREADNRVATSLAVAQLSRSARLGAAQIAAASRLSVIDKAIQGRLQYAQRTGLTSKNLAALTNQNIKLAQSALAQIPIIVNQAQIEFDKKDASPEDKAKFQQIINDTEASKDYYNGIIKDGQKRLDDYLNQDMSNQGIDYGSNAGSDSTANTNTNKPVESKSTPKTTSTRQSSSVSKDVREKTTTHDEDKSGQLTPQQIVDQIKQALPQA